jgi:hypothetical protein
VTSLAQQFQVFFKGERAIDQIKKIAPAEAHLPCHHAQQLVADFLLAVADLRADNSLLPVAIR